MGKIICKFCNLKKEKSKEHIWPKWLQKHITGSTKSNFRGTHMAYLGGVISERNQSGESLVFGNICSDCNNGWMANLENKFRPIYFNIVSDYNKLKKLTKNERNIICKWSLKTAMMINSGTNYRQIIPELHYDHLFNYRELPKNIKVDIAYIESEDDLMWQQSNIAMETIKESDYKNNDPHDLTRNSYVITMQIQKLSIKIIHYHELKEKNYQIPVSNNEKSIRIWPYQKNGLFKLTNSYEDISGFHLNTHIVK